ncbi:hypothetical protein HYV89_02720 [Candidatus Woesearchaeota archaeon]|nr:hypothetical protein [Candidatus Woesearchaeota archaeon]
MHYKLQFIINHKKVDSRPAKEGEKAFNDAVALINGDIPEKKCEWCEGKL